MPVTFFFRVHLLQYIIGFESAPGLYLPHLSHVAPIPIAKSFVLYFPSPRFRGEGQGEG